MDSTPTQGTNAEARLLSRRHLLAIGSLAAAAPLFPRLAWSDEVVTKAVANGFRPLSVGYIQRAEAVGDVRALLATTLERMAGSEAAGLENLRVVAADQLPRGDASLFSQTLRVRVHAFSPRLGAPGASRDMPALGVELDLLVPLPDASPNAERLPFFAWSYRPDGPNQSQTISFALPVERENPPELRLTVRPTGGEAATYLARSRWTTSRVDPG